MFMKMISKAMNRLLVCAWKKEGQRWAVNIWLINKKLFFSKKFERTLYYSGLVVYNEDVIFIY